MSDFKAKMHKFKFGWGCAPDPAYSAPQTRQLDLRGPASKGGGR